MATMNFSIPADVKDSFNRFFERRNKSAVITALMLEAIDREKRARAHDKAMESIGRMQAGHVDDDDDDVSEFAPRGPHRLYP